MDDHDAFDNPAVRAALERLLDLHTRFTTAAPADFQGQTLVSLALDARMELEESLRASGSSTDYDQFALCALQEALRSAFAPEQSGFRVTPAEIASRLVEKHLTARELWMHYFAQYAGMLFEHQVSGSEETGANQKEIWQQIAEFRANLALVYGEKTVETLDPDDLTIEKALASFRATMTGESS